MNDQFIPFVPSDLIAFAATPKTPFTQVAPGSTAGPSSHAGRSSPNVTLKRDGDRVTHICVQCACGETIELACVY